MYKKSDVNPLKGKRGGDCNVTQCQKPNAIMYNNGMRTGELNVIVSGTGGKSIFVGEDNE